jgi:hypothetical protein
MFKKYNPKPIHSYKSYKISDLCRIYKIQDLHPQTIRKWINQQGLKAFLHERDFYIYGAVLKEFLTSRNQKNKAKRSLDFDQFRCGQCKSKEPPKNKIITRLTTGFNNCLLAFGVCNKCGHEINRPYKRAKLTEIHEIFQVQLADELVLCNSSISTNKTNINISEKVVVSESLNIKKGEVRKVKPSTAKETEQLTLFDFMN